jgi:hypothetical protein
MTMDDAFKPLSQIVEGLVPLTSGFFDEEAGVHTYVTSYEVETPIELDVSQGQANELRIGSTPPLYPLMTTVSPVFHRLKFTLTLDRSHADG